MSAAPIDYDALAQKHGSSVDYDALAQKHGAVNAAPAAAFQDPAEAPQQSLLSQAGNAVKNAGIGLAKGALHTISESDEWARKHLPAFLTNSNMGFGPPANEQHVQEMATPHGTAQNIGYGGEQIGEFLLPTGLEEGGAKLGGELLGHGGEVAGKLLGAGVHSGIINKAQGGGFGAGAAMGVGGSAIGQGLQAVAPHAVELAQGIKNAGGRTGRAILNETSGILPGAIRSSAKGVTNDIGSQLGDVMQQVSQRPISPIRGLLQAPEYDVPLHSSPDVAGDASRPITLNQADRPMLRGLPTPSEDIPMSSYHSLFPEQLPSGTSSVRAPITIEGNTEGMGPGQYIGQIPGERGGLGSPQGTLRTRDPLIHGQAEPSAPELPYRGISLAPVRNMAADAVGDANLRGDVKLAKGVGKINQNTLLNRGLEGPRPETVSPYEYWQTKRGVGDAVSATKWRPGYNDPFSNVQKRLYGQMADTLHTAVPESIPLDTRYSNLIPATKPPASSLWGHAAGPLAGTILGGTEGYNHGGVGEGIKGALIGGTIGAAAPTLLNAGSRFFYSPATQRLLPAATGAILQATDR